MGSLTEAKILGGTGSILVILAVLPIPLLGTAALIYLIGALLVGVLVGFLVIIVAQILQVLAFFSLPKTVPVAG